ncbi:MAG TPA: hypothetical protein VF018_14015 [Acidobacteriaceae bacterium]
MTELAEKIAQSYPLLAGEFSRLTEEGASDSQLMEELGSHVVDLFEKGRTDDVRPAFNLAERLLATGTDAERHAAMVGFLETVQNVASHRECGAAVFEEFLGAWSRKAWAELNQIWQGKTSLAEVVAAETGASVRPPRWQFWKRRKRMSAREMLETVENPDLRKLIEKITRE